MAKSISVTRKRPGRPPTGVDPHVTARLPKDLIDKLEDWAKVENLSRSEAIRRLLELGLKGKRNG